MGQNHISKKEIKCIDKHLSKCVDAIMRDCSFDLETSFIEYYDSDSYDFITTLLKSFVLVRKLYEKK